jgi:hypothetical protein
MRKRLGILGISIAAVALTLGVALPAAGSSRSADRDHTFRVTATLTEAAQLDLGTAGPSLGDEIVFTGKLLQGGHQIGHQGGTCTTVSMQRHEAQCVATYSFRAGQITGQTVIVLGSPARYQGAITGGTGRFTGAEGVVHVRPATATNPTGTLTFDLED